MADTRDSRLISEPVPFSAEAARCANRLLSSEGISNEASGEGRFLTSVSATCAVHRRVIINWVGNETEGNGEGTKCGFVNHNIFRGFFILLSIISLFPRRVLF